MCIRDRSCVRRGVNLGYLMKSGDSLITRARQSILTHFLSETKATHLLFVDSDIGFEPEQVFRLLDFDADVTAAAYPVTVSYTHLDVYKRQVYGSA